MPTIPNTPGGYAPFSRESIVAAANRYLANRAAAEVADRLHGVSTAHRAADVQRLKLLAENAEGPIMLSTEMAYMFEVYASS